MKPTCVWIGLLLMFTAAAWAQDPVSSADHPAGNVNELTLAGLRPGEARIGAAIARFGKGFTHPSAEERDVYVWCDAHAGVQLTLEANAGGTIQVVTVSAIGAAGASAGKCAAKLSIAAAATGRGVKLGTAVADLTRVYGQPFFDGPSSLDGKDVRFVVFNFSWAGTNKPQVLESSFNAAGKLVKMTLSAEYY